MTEKRVKAWAVVDEHGLIRYYSPDAHGCPYSTFQTRREARTARQFPGERVVPVTIIVEES